MKGLKELSIGDNCFCRFHMAVFEDLPTLTSIELGIGVFEGDEQNQNLTHYEEYHHTHSSHLDLSKLQSFTAGKCGFGNANEVLFESGAETPS